MIKLIGNLPSVVMLLAFASAPVPVSAQNNPPVVMTVSPTGVNLQDGSYAFSATDISMGSLQLERMYLGGPAVAVKTFGNSWSHNFNSALIFRGGSGPFAIATLDVVIGMKTYQFSGYSTFTPKNGYEGISFGSVGGIWTLIERDGTKYQFSGATSSSVLNKIISPDGTDVSLSYASGRLKTVISNRGYALVFDYNGNGSVSNACGFNLTLMPVSNATTCASASLKTSYTYASGTNGHLSSATDVMGAVSNIYYASTSALDGDVTCVTTPGTGVCKVTNTYIAGHPSQVQKQNLADGTKWKFYTDGGFADRTGDQDPYTATGATMIDPYNNEFNMAYYMSSPIYFVDQRGYITDIGFLGPIYLGAILPEGNGIVNLISSRSAPAGTRWSAKTGSTAAPFSSVKSFSESCTNPVTCNRPDTETDANGNVTSYTYDATHGSVLTKVAPAVGGIAPVTRYFYTLRYAWIKSSAGTAYVQAATGIYLLTEERACKTTATVAGTCAGGASDEVVTSYDYGPNSGPNNLTLRGMVADAGTGRLNLRTCYTYDGQGNKISQTLPKAGLSSCP